MTVTVSDDKTFVYGVSLDHKKTILHGRSKHTALHNSISRTANIDFKLSPRKGLIV